MYEQDYPRARALLEESMARRLTLEDPDGIAITFNSLLIKWLDEVLSPH